MSDLTQEVKAMTVSGGQSSAGEVYRDRDSHYGGRPPGTMNQQPRPGNRFGNQQGSRHNNNASREAGGVRNTQAGRSNEDNWRGGNTGDDVDRRRNDRQQGGVAQHIAGGVVIKELDGDLFTAPSDHSLAHCVAVDMRMGSGIAVTFRSKFGRLAELLDQRSDVGGMAVLQEGSRYLYYLTTKELSREKPTMRTLRRSLEAMKLHCAAHCVTKLAMPRIGCGLDRLDWTQVKAMLHEVFADTDLAITVYNFPQNDDERDVDSAPKKKAALYVTHQKLPLVSIAAKTGLLYLCSEESLSNPTSVSLDQKHCFLQQASNQPRGMGTVVRTEHRGEVFYGLVVRKRAADAVSYAALVDCLKQLRKFNDKDYFEYFGVEAFRDGRDRVATEKLVTVMRNIFSVIKYTLEVWVCWPPDIEGDHEWEAAAGQK